MSSARNRRLTTSFVTVAVIVGTAASLIAISMSSHGGRPGSIAGAVVDDGEAATVTARVNRLELVDEAGRVRAVLGFEDSEAPGLPPDPSLRIIGDNQETQIRIGFDRGTNRNAIVEMLDWDGNRSLLFSVHPRGDVDVVAGTAGRQASLNIAPNRGPKVELSEPAGGFLSASVGNRRGKLWIRNEDLHGIQLLTAPQGATIYLTDDEGDLVPITPAIP